MGLMGFSEEDVQRFNPSMLSRPEKGEAYVPMTREQLLHIVYINKDTHPKEETDPLLLKKISDDGVIIITDEVVKNIDTISYGLPPQPANSREHLQYESSFTLIRQLVNCGYSWRRTYVEALSFRCGKYCIGLNRFVEYPFQQIQKISNRPEYRMKFAAVYTLICHCGVILPLFA